MESIPLLRIILSVDPDDVTADGDVPVTADISIADGPPPLGIGVADVLYCLQSLVENGRLAARAAAVWGEDPPDLPDADADPPLPDVLEYVAARLAADGVIPDGGRIVGFARMEPGPGVN